MQLIGTRGGDDAHLSAGPLAILDAIGVGDDVELADGIDAEQLAAGAAGSVVD